MTEVVCLTVPTRKPICLAKATIVAFTDYRILLMGGVWLDVQESYAEIMAAYEGEIHREKSGPIVKPIGL